MILAAIQQIEERQLNCAGYRKVTDILNSDTSKIEEYNFNFDFSINIKRVRRIMREHGECQECCVKKERSSPKCWCKLNSANLSFHKLKHTGFF
ncbi:transposase [Limosilactobacillus fermentum]|uniref:transposase n=1 Tax=Limosilactobacillus fermentum TaxID=1613 RepID=UPI003DA146B7